MAFDYSAVGFFPAARGRGGYLTYTSLSDPMSSILPESTSGAYFSPQRTARDDKEAEEQVLRAMKEFIIAQQVYDPTSQNVVVSRRQSGVLILVRADSSSYENPNDAMARSVSGTVRTGAVILQGSALDGTTVKNLVWVQDSSTTMMGTLGLNTPMGSLPSVRHDFTARPGNIASLATRGVS